MAVVRVAPVPLLRGSVQVPPDKSLTHRALLLAAIGDREVGDRAAARLRGHRGDARRWSRPAGCRSRATSATRCASSGRGLRGLRPPPALDCANAGTLMRLAGRDPRGAGQRPRRARRRRLAARPPDVAGRHAAARDGRAGLHRPRRHAADGRERRGAAARASSTGWRWRAPRSRAACCWPASTPRARPGCTSRRRRATTPSACWRRPASPLLREGGAVGRDRPGGRARAARPGGARRLLLGRRPARGRRAARRPRGAPAGRQPQPGPHRA